MPTKNFHFTNAGISIGAIFIGVCDSGNPLIPQYDITTNHGAAYIKDRRYCRSCVIFIDKAYNSAVWISRI